MQRCSCPMTFKIGTKNGLLMDSPKARRTKGGNFVSSSQDCNSHPRSRHVSMSSETGPDVTAFPVSGHGRHSRRASDRDGARRMSDIADTFPAPSLDGLLSNDTTSNGHAGLAVPESVNSVSPRSKSPSSASRRSFRSVRLLEVTCERGGWGIVNGKLAILRRKPRNLDSSSQGPSKIHHNTDANQLGLSVTTLDRWEVWMLDFSKAKHIPSSSSLSLLSTTSMSPIREITSIPGHNPNKSAPRLPFTRLAPLLFRNAVCVAGFGNTIGMIDFGPS